MGFFSSIGKAFKSIGQKVAQGATFIGQKSLQGLDLGIQGLKIGSDFADKYTFGFDHLIPYYAALKAGIDISDHIRKMAKGEEKLNWSNAEEMGKDLGFGLMSFAGGGAEIQAYKGAFKMFNSARKTGSSLLEASKFAGGRLLRGYGAHPQQLKQMSSKSLTGVSNVLKLARKGNIRALAKVGVGVGAVSGAITTKVKADLEDSSNMRREMLAQPSDTLNKSTNPPPRILQKPEPVNIHSVPIVPPTPLIFRGNNIYKNGKLVG